MDRKPLSKIEIDAALKTLDGWAASSTELTKKWKFKDFAQALDFVNKVGVLAEAADHHPDIKLGWGYVEIGLTTHDRGGVTDVDLDLAAEIGRISPP
ncbi:MAG: 4a-hydroxytetrahydrobiopterin dehydratase [Pyrinomonadaceae bacterium]